MTNMKMGAFLLLAFIAGAFVASPELRAYAADTITSADIVDNTIQSIDIKNGTLTTVDLANGAVTNSKLAANSVGSLKIADGTVLTQDIGNGAVMSSDISDTNGVKSVDIVNGEVKTADVADGNVTNSKLAANSVDSSKISNDAVGESEIATDAVGADELIGVTKLSFTQCVLTDAEAKGMVLPGGSLGVQCTGTGIDGDDSIVATINGSAHPCFGVTRAFFNGVSLTVEIRNACDGTLAPGKSGIGVIVFDK